MRARTWLAVPVPDAVREGVCDAEAVHDGVSEPEAVILRVTLLDGEGVWDPDKLAEAVTVLVEVPVAVPAERRTVVGQRRLLPYRDRHHIGGQAWF